MLDIQSEEDKIALKTGDVNAGFQAWITQLQHVQSAGELTLEGLDQTMKGFEDTAINSLMAVMTAQRGEHLKLIRELDKMWSQYFDGLAKMAMKQGMNQLLAPLLKPFQKQPPGQEDPFAPSAKGALTGLGSFPKAGGAAGLTQAGGLLSAAARELSAAAAALRGGAVGAPTTSSGIPFLGGMGGGGGADAGGSLGAGGDFAGFFAEGGDVTPGSSFVSGEAGAEQVDLDRSGGAHITPLGFSASGGGDTHQHFDMRGAVVTDDLMRRAEAAALVHASQKQMMGAMPAQQREINLRKRGV
jgi:hypothetical protein